MKFKKSRFAIFTPSDTGENVVHIYHTLLDHHVIVEQAGDLSVIDLIDKLEQGSDLTKEETENVEALARMGFLVPSDSDEQEVFESWYKKVLRGANDSLVVHVTTTMACNMRCSYCMERDRLDQSRFMKNGTTFSVASWVKRRLISKGARKLSLVFFGGEPLLNVSALEAVAGDLKEFCSEHKITFKAGIITNGTLLTKEVANVMERSGISWVKVTLDGDRDCHDKYRHFANGDGSFDRIWSNLEAVAGKLDIYIGGNFSAGNEKSFMRLVEMLRDSPFKKSIVDVRFKPVMSPKKKGELPVPSECDKGAFTMEQVDKMLNLRGVIKEAGLPIIEDPNVGPCDFYRPNVVTIGVEGEIYPCAGFVGIPDFVVGYVDREGLTEFGKKLESTKSWDGRCFDCAFLPLCAGGCRLPAYLSGKGVEEAVCDIDFYERMVPHLVAAYRGHENPEDRKPGIYA